MSCQLCIIIVVQESEASVETEEDHVATPSNHVNNSTPVATPTNNTSTHDEGGATRQDSRGGGGGGGGGSHAVGAAKKSKSGNKKSSLMAINVSATDTHGLLGDAYGLCIWIQTQHPLHNGNILVHSLEVVLAFEVLLALTNEASVCYSTSSTMSNHEHSNFCWHCQSHTLYILSSCIPIAPSFFSMSIA